MAQKNKIYSSENLQCDVLLLKISNIGIYSANLKKKSNKEPFMFLEGFFFSWGVERGGNSLWNKFI